MILPPRPAQEPPAHVDGHDTVLCGCGAAAGTAQPSARRRPVPTKAVDVEVSAATSVWRYGRDRQWPQLSALRLIHAACPQQHDDCAGSCQARHFARPQARWPHRAADPAMSSPHAPACRQDPSDHRQSRRIAWQSAVFGQCEVACFSPLPFVRKFPSIVTNTTIGSDAIIQKDRCSPQEPQDNLQDDLQDDYRITPDRHHHWY